MMDITEALDVLLRLLAPALKEANFTAAAGTEDGSRCFENPAGNQLRIALEDNRSGLYLDEKRLALALLELESATERDCNYIAGEFAEALLQKCAPKKPGAAASGKKQPPKSISKTAIKNGDAYYDALAFGNSFTSLFPQLRGAYKTNYETYGEFLGEEFFLEHGNALVHELLRSGDKVQLGRLFGLLNEAYENGVNDVQSLIAVTILGSLGNDAVLLARCVDYMSKDLTPVVLRVNKYLAKNKSAVQKLQNPPLYKPKKAKKPGLFQQLMGGGGGQGLGG